MAVLPLVAVQSNVQFDTEDLVYTVPASAGGGNVQEAFLVDMQIINTHPLNIDLSCYSYVDDGVNTYEWLSNEIVRNESFTTDIDVWNKGNTIISSPAKFPRKSIGLTVGDEIYVGNGAVSSRSFEITNFDAISVIATIHLVNDL